MAFFNLRAALSLGIALASLASCKPPERRQTGSGSYPNPIPCTGGACIDFQDTNVIIGPPAPNTGNTYYRFSKGDKPGDGIKYATSPTLRGDWEYRGTVVDGPLKDPKFYGHRNDTHLWAPQVNKVRGTYFMTFGLFNPAIGFDVSVATSQTLSLGSWTDQGPINIPPSPKYNGRSLYSRLGASIMGIAPDPSGFAVDPPFVAFGSYASGIYGVEMANPPYTIANNATPTLLISDQPLPVNEDNPRMNRTEGPFMFKRAPKEYYVFYSRGNCCPTRHTDVDTVYRIEVCRAKAATGPYYDRAGLPCSGSINQSGTVVLETHDDVLAPGSMGILRDPVEGLVMYYQYKNRSADAYPGLNFGFNKLYWTHDNWPYLDD